MASIKYDAQGFPIGELLRSGKDFTAEQELQTGLLRNIRSEVRSIARAMGVQVAQVRRASNQSVAAAVAQRGATRRQGAASPSGRGNAGRSGGLFGQSAGGPSGRSRAAAEGRASRATAAVVPVGRDSRGRFVAGASKSGDTNGAGNATPAFGATLSRLSDGVSRLSASVSGAESVDANIAAANEVKEAVAPLGRGFSFLFGRSAERKKERWYHRFLKALTGKKKDEQKVIVSGGGGLSGLLGLLPALLGLQGGLPGFGLPGGRGARGGGVGLWGRLKRGAGGLLRRVPMLGALIAGGSALGSLLGLDDDPNATPEENRARRYAHTGQAVGMGLGGTLGAILGSFLGPAGTIGGGLLGSIIGEKVGGAVGNWARQLMDSDIPGRVMEAWGVFTAGASAAWDSFATDAKATWSTVVGKVSEWWDSAKDVAESALKTISDVGNAANQWVKDKTGVDVREHAGMAWDATKDAAGNAWDKTKQKASSAWGRTKELAAEASSAVAGATSAAIDAMTPETVKRAAAAASKAATQARAGYREARGRETDAPAPAGPLQRGARSTGHAVGTAAEWTLGKTSKEFESGKRGAGAVSTGEGDHGGPSYGTYQLSSKRGTLSKFLSESGYAEAFAGLTPGSAAFNAKWKEIANSDPAFATAQHDFIKRTHYDKAAAGLKAAGLDLSGRGAAVLDALWSTSVQFGPGSAMGGGGAVGLFQKALQGRDLTKMTDAEIVAAVQDYKAANNERLFASSSEAWRAGTLERAYTEKAALLKLATVTANPVPRPAVADIPAPVPTTIPPAPEVKELPSQLNTPARERLVVVPQNTEPGQNVGDRSLAHIVTGGLGGS